MPNTKGIQNKWEKSSASSFFTEPVFVNVVSVVAVPQIALLLLWWLETHNVVYLCHFLTYVSNLLKRLSFVELAWKTSLLFLSKVTSEFDKFNFISDMTNASNWNSEVRQEGKKVSFIITISYVKAHQIFILRHL